MKILFILVLAQSILFSQNKNYIDPTGVYKLDSKTYEKGDETYGYSGIIKVAKATNKKIYINLYVCKGAPSYNSGTLIDSVEYINNTATYHAPPDYDSTCTIIFKFDRRGVFADMTSQNPNFACGFGHAVDAQGYYKKIRSKPPTKEDVLKDSDD